MIFRLRVFLLVVVLVAITGGLTAWLTVEQASRQASRTVAANDRTAADIATSLVRYGVEHGTWYGVQSQVSDLSRATGDHLRLATQAGSVLADSDALAGRDPRPVVGSDLAVNPVPVLPTDLSLTGGAVFTLFNDYATGLVLASCVVEAGGDVSLSVTGARASFETQRVAPDVRSRCTQAASSQRAKADSLAVSSAVDRCPSADVARRQCAQQIFARAIARYAAEPITVSITETTRRAASINWPPIVGITGAVVLLALLCAVIISRPVLRPVRVLTQAVERVGAGGLSTRVPVSGRDEIGRLSARFNTMAESLAASERRQHQLIADISHELRTPLTNLRGHIEALQDGVADADPSTLASMHEEALLQQRILDDLHDLALAESGELTYQREFVDPGALLERAVVPFRRVALASGIELVTDIECGTEPVLLDPDRIRQAASNLLTNAVRATATGGSIGLSAADESDDLVVRVWDTGVGMSADQARLVFDRLYRADPSRARRTGGSGLGLTITRQIVIDHDGQLVVERTAPGQGTVMRLSVPRVTPG